MFHVKQSENNIEKQLTDYCRLLDFDERIRNQSLTFLEMVLDYNQKVNLISRKDEENIVPHHWLHSVIISKVLKFDSFRRILDIGSGGGFPGLALAIVFPGVEFVLTDSIGKKTTFLESVVRELNLKNVVVENKRVEFLHRQQRKGVDAVIARAVTSLSKLWQYSVPFFKEQGMLIAWKGSVDDELKELKEKFSNFSRIEIHQPPDIINVEKLKSSNFVTVYFG
ncbi:MAG: hypothetical protein Kow00108_04980 [Calditrichia bacterium]